MRRRHYIYKAFRKLESLESGVKISKTSKHRYQLFCLFIFCFLGMNSLRFLLSCCASFAFVMISGVVAGNQQNFTFLEGNQQELLQDGYARELHNAFSFAQSYGITTAPNIQEAQMHEPLTRIAMAKMLSLYALQVLHQTGDSTQACSFGDVPEELDLAYHHGAQLACQLGIMGVGVEAFRPYDVVSRAEFATAVGRLLYHIQDEEKLYYRAHLATLHKL